MICAKLGLDLHNYGIRVMIVLQELWLLLFCINKENLICGIKAMVQELMIFL